MDGADPRTRDMDRSFPPPEAMCESLRTCPPEQQTEIVHRKARTLDRLARILRRRCDSRALDLQDQAIQLARSVSDHELVAELSWHMSLCWHRTIDEGESMDVALEGMHAAQLAGSELWTRICRAEAIFDGLGGTYPRVSTPLDWAPEAQSLETAIAAMRSHVAFLAPLHPDASFIMRAYLACLLLWDGQSVLARREWNHAIASAHAARSGFAESEILALREGGMWDDETG